VTPLWIVQKNLGDQTALMAALDAEDIPHRDIIHIPFSNELPDVEWNGPVICYGATRFITTALAAGRWKPGAFFDPETFRHSVAHAHYGKALLNHVARVLPMSEFRREPHAPDDLFFLRPDADLKDFPGALLEWREFEDWYGHVSAGGVLFEPSIPVVVGAPIRIAREWRLFMLEGKCLAATQYRQEGRLAIKEGAPPAVVAFAESLARTWMPAPVAVYDVALSYEEFRLGLLEINCFNSAGFYAADVRRIVREVTAFVQREACWETL